MTRLARTLCGVAVAAALFLAGWQAAIPPLPPTPQQPVATEYHGIKVVDDYRWLENSQDPKVQSWLAAENAHARVYLDRVAAHGKIEQWLESLEQQRSPDYYEMRFRSGRLFALKSQPPRQQPLLVTLDAAADPASEHLVLDPVVLDPKGATAIDFYVPSLDGKLVAVSLAEGGSENGSVRVYDVSSGRALPDVVPGVEFPTAGGSLAWNADASGFYYTRYPQGNERPPEDRHFYQHIYFHKLGTPAGQDAYVLGKDLPRIAETTLATSEDGQYVLASVGNGDGGDFEHFLLRPAGDWIQITRYADQISATAFGQDGALYLVSRKDAPRGRMLRLPLATPELVHAQTVVPESDAIIQGFRMSTAGMSPNFVATEDRLYVVYVVGGPTEVRVFDHAGHRLREVPILPVSTVSQLLSLNAGEILFRNGSYLTPPAWYRFDPQTERAEQTALRVTSPVNFNDSEVVREFAVSRDGTKVPLNIIRRKGSNLDGKNPAVLTGYGGFGLSLSPYFSASLRLWLDAGGVYAVANLRGGGEFGEEWHQAGMLTHKQNVFDDFIACGQHLIERRYTNPSKLGIEGGSNGGLLMAAAFTQHPELFRAVVSIAGLYDMLRMETSPNGQFNTTEYGSVKNAEQFRAIYAYSPYHHVRDGTRYPAILFIAGENDMRVESWQSRKMTARLQAATSSKLPILLVSFAQAGHGGIGAAQKQRIAMSAYAWSFLFDQLGVPYHSTTGVRSPAM